MTREGIEHLAAAVGSVVSFVALPPFDMPRLTAWAIIMLLYVLWMETASLVLDAITRRRRKRCKARSGRRGSRTGRRAG
ncbi:MAG: hypothetical protein MRZ45_09385 [Blautia sp.]|nr:hypothetical protein [Blautia sp.]